MKQLAICGVLLCMGCLFLAGCPTDNPPFDATGNYTGTWKSDSDANANECPLKLTLQHTTDAVVGRNFALSGSATIDLSCFGLGDLLNGILTIPPVNVTGFIDNDGGIHLASPELLDQCQDPLCIRLILDGAGVDADHDGHMDSYSGTWTAALVVNGNVPVPLQGTFTLQGALTATN